MDRQDQPHSNGTQADGPSTLDDAESLQALGDSYADQGRWADALEAYAAALALDPANAWLHNNLGTVYEELGRTAEAEEAYRSAIACDPIDSVAYANLGSLYEEQGRFREAIQSYRQCLKVSTDAAERRQIKERLNQLSQAPELVTIATFGRVAEAYIPKAKLEAEGIWSFIKDEHIVAPNWLYSNLVGSVKLQVRAPEAERALEILAEPH